MSTEQYKIGDIIHHSKAYARKCSGRFRTDYRTVSKHPIPLPIQEGSAVVVGVRTVIMDNYNYVNKGGGWMGDDDDPPYATGDVENVLLACKHIREEPFIVRMCDAVKLPRQS